MTFPEFPVTGLPVAVSRPLVALIPWLLAGACLAAAPAPERRAGAALAALWNLVALTAVNAVATAYGWWTFGTAADPVVGATWQTVPLDVIAGWALLWGAVPVLLGAHLRPPVIAAVLIAADLAAMPALSPLVGLGPWWLLGEAAAILVALLPGLVLGELTARRRALRVRSALQILLFTTLLTWGLPSIALAAAGRGWADALDRWPRPVLLIWVQIGLGFAVLAHRAVAEFAEHGGTPFPWDPPTALVTTGPYAYLANPMQAAATAILLVESVALVEWRLAAAAIAAVVFSAGVAAVHENTQLGDRFGASWRAYRNAVRPWLPRRAPVGGGGAATLFVSATCGVCAPVGAWFAARAPSRLAVVAAETHPAGLRRARYRRTSPDGAAAVTADGLAAIGRALEHLGLGWALLGWLLRAPLLAPVLQVTVDALGGGPRTLPRS